MGTKAQDMKLTYQDDTIFSGQCTGFAEFIKTLYSYSRTKQEAFIFYAKKVKTNTFYMKVMVQMKDYQVVVKKQGTKSIPPVSSPVLPDPPLRR